MFCLWHHYSRPHIQRHRASTKEKPLRTGRCGGVLCMVPLVGFELTTYRLQGGTGNTGCCDCLLECSNQRTVAFGGTLVLLFESVGAECLTRTDDLPLTLPLRLSPPAPLGRSWSGLSLSHGPKALGSPRLVSTPSP
jgi:hypothetical protein